MRSRILVVGRDVAQRARLAQVLNGGGYRVELAESAAHARQVDLKGVDLAILAQDGPGSAKNRTVEELEAATGRVLVVGGQADDAGLLARVAEALRPEPETEEVAPAPLRFADYTLDLAGHSLTNQAGTEIPLSRGGVFRQCDKVRFSACAGWRPCGCTAPRSACWRCAHKVRG